MNKKNMKWSGDYDMQIEKKYKQSKRMKNRIQDESEEKEVRTRRLTGQFFFPSGATKGIYEPKIK